PSRAHVLDPGISPSSKQPLVRPPRREVADARPEEAADALPSGGDRPAGDRKSRAHVELPQRPPEAPRDGELQRRNRAARADHARKLAYRRGRVVDIPEQVREGECVEGLVVERQALPSPFDE